MTLGLFIGRLNPPHIGHINIIKRALKENKKVLVLLGTPFLYNKNNPLDFNTRKKILEKIFKDENIKILEIKDKKTDLEWINNIKNILEKFLLTEGFNTLNKINFYGGDFENDSAFKVFKKYAPGKKYSWFEEKFINCTFNYVLNSRINSFIKYKNKKYKISATNLREALYNKNYKLAKQFCIQESFEEIKKGFLK